MADSRHAEPQLVTLDDYLGTARIEPGAADQTVAIHNRACSQPYFFDLVEH